MCPERGVVEYYRDDSLLWALGLVFLSLSVGDYYGGKRRKWELDGEATLG